MSDPTTCENTPNATSSPVSEDGHLHCDSLDGMTLAEYGQALAPANLSASQAKTMGWLTSGIFGQRGFISSASANLTSYLANKLMQRFDKDGSILFKLIWKDSVTPSGRRIFRLRASGRRTSDSGFGGWPTPNAGPQNDGDTTWQDRRKRLKAEHKNGNGFGMTLGQASSLTAWPTPNAEDQKWRYSTYEGAARHPASGKQVGLECAAQMTSWATPTTRDHKDGQCQNAKVEINGLLWSSSVFIDCRDGKTRPIKPGIFPLAHGVSARVGKLRAAGNAIVPQVAAEFIKAVMECKP